MMMVQLSMHGGCVVGVSLALAVVNGSSKCVAPSHNAHSKDAHAGVFSYQQLYCRKVVSRCCFAAALQKPGVKCKQLATLHGGQLSQHPQLHPFFILASCPQKEYLLA
jgi:hypothetical protein